ncbi:MAG: hypothetical protein HZB15_09765 [Actinobacteria bacterium]|nr:hypothetical protein [Actinomycetota bacterium]
MWGGTSHVSVASSAGPGADVAAIAPDSIDAAAAASGHPTEVVGYTIASTTTTLAANVAADRSTEAVDPADAGAPTSSGATTTRSDALDGAPSAPSAVAGMSTEAMADPYAVLNLPTKGAGVATTSSAPPPEPPATNAGDEPATTSTVPGSSSSTSSTVVATSTSTLPPESSTTTTDGGATTSTADAAPPPAGDPDACTISELLVPSCGAWFGASTPSSDGRYDYEVGLDEYLDVVSTTPDILHFYHTNAATFPTASELAMSERDGEQVSLLFYNWKPSTSLTWREIADGGADDNIEVVARGLSRYPGRLFLTIHHEPENDQGSVGSGRTPADYVDMYRHVVTRLRDLGVTNAVFVMNYMGFEKWGPVADDFYPGDDVVDWIAYDPYAFAGQPTFAAMLNQASGDWPGFYEWAVGRAPGKPIMLGEWGFDLTTQPNSAKALDGAVDALQTRFPMVKALVYWNDRTDEWNFRLDQGLALSDDYAAAFARLAADPYFNSTTLGAPLVSTQPPARTARTAGNEALDPPPEIPEFPLPVVAVLSGVGLVGVLMARRSRR